MSNGEQMNPDFSATEIVATAKPLVADRTSKIQLHDLVVDELKRFLSETGNQNFPLEKQFSNQELSERVSRYEKSVSALCGLLVLISYWGARNHKVILQQIFARSTDQLVEESGLHVWLSLRWYPIILELYCAGISLVYGGRYHSLNDILYTKIASSNFYDNEQYFGQFVTKGLTKIERDETFKRLPGHERQHTPLNEYLLKTLQPMLDEVLFMGNNYERSFDEFEVLFSLIVADMNKQHGQTAWGPIGRFGWKQQNHNQPPFARIVEEAKRLQEKWPPLAAGLFGGDYQRFINLLEDFEKILREHRYW
jgi:hypothetical protein